MPRFFFDYAAGDQRLYDYQGDEFNSSQSAIEYAERISEHLGHSLQNDWIGWHVEVRNAVGMKLSSFPVSRNIALAAANNA
jgi:hypothetical protein